MISISSRLGLAATGALAIALSACTPPAKNDAAATGEATKTTTEVVPDESAAPAPAPAAEAAPDGHGTRDAVDWNGTYAGTLPCASCEGIKTELTLNKDGTYAMTETYVGEKDGPQKASGKFTWDKAGGIITLDDKGDKRAYRVGEGQMWALDANNKEVTGDLAKNYILTKK